MKHTYIRWALKNWYNHLPFNPKLLYIILIMTAIFFSIWIAIVVMILWHIFLAYIYWDEVMWLNNKFMDLTDPNKKVEEAKK
jgi:hypothetical protein